MSAASTSVAGAARAARSAVSEAAGQGVRRERPVTRGQLSIVPQSAPPASTVTRVYLNGIPRTATATDILHALRAQKLVSSDFSVNNITSSAVSLPRSGQVALHRQWHVALPSNAHAFKVLHALRSQVSSSDPVAAGLFPGFWISPSLRPVEFTNDHARQYRVKQREQLILAAARRKGQISRDGSGTQQEATSKWDVWPLDDSLSFNGKGVLLVGMPPGAGWLDVKGLLALRVFGDRSKGSSDLGLLQTEDGVIKLPSSGSRNVSWFVLRFETAAQAHRAVRKLNMTTYQAPRRLPESDPPKYLLRAEIAN